MSTKMLFAVLKQTGDLVEVGDVPRGQPCCCVCPSCGQGVLARHGNVNSWHFAHDPASEDKPVIACDISFYSSCRQFAIKMATSGSITSLQTPDWVLGHSVYVTKGRLLEGVEFVAGKRFDLKAVVGSRTLFVHFDYPGRGAPDLEGLDADAGVLRVNLEDIEDEYYSLKSEPGLIRLLIQGLMERSKSSKSWLQHPLFERAIAELKQKTAIRENAFRAPRHSTSDSRDELTREPTPSLSVPRSVLTGRFSCRMCGCDWKGVSDHDRDCPACDTHLFAVFIPD